MSIVFQNLNPKPGIGANSYLLDFGPTRVVLDAGLSPTDEGIDAVPSFDGLEPESVDAAIITHSHLDHFGTLPVLMRHQPHAEVLMTAETMQLGAALLHNSVNVMCSKREELNITEYPLFTHKQVDAASRWWSERRVGRPFEIGDHGLRAEFFHAGHIPGSVGVTLEWEGRRIFYTGDVHFENQTMSMGANFPNGDIDALIIETTRGSVPRPPEYSRAAERDRMGAAITESFGRGGSVMIPVFALGKTQEVLLMLQELREADAIPRCPVIIGGLSTKMTVIIDRFASHSRRLFRGFEILEEMDLTVAARRRKKEIDLQPGCIYALSSGMMTEHTLSNRFAAQFLPNSSNLLVFVGYADPVSPAGRIRSARRGEKVTLHEGQAEVGLNCEVAVFDFSSHAPRADLLDYILEVAPKKTLLVHGDPDATDWFRAKLGEKLPQTEALVPAPGDRIEIA